MPDPRFTRPARLQEVPEPDRQDPALQEARESAQAPVGECVPSGAVDFHTQPSGLIKEKLFTGSYGVRRSKKNAGKRIAKAASENKPKEMKEIRAAAEVVRETSEPRETVTVVESQQVVEISNETKVVKAKAKEDKTVKVATEKKKPEKTEQEAKKVKHVPAAKPAKAIPAGDETPKPKTQKKPAAKK